MYTQALLGYRQWGLNEEGLLVSSGLGQTTWRPGLNLAYCLNHLAPDPSCECGLYASFDLPRRGEKFAYGTVLGKGHIEIHRDGFRAAEMMPLALLGGKNLIQQDRLERAAQIYGIPLFKSVPELIEFSSGYGMRVPKELVPGREAITKSVLTTTNEKGQYHSYNDMPAQKFIDSKGHIFKQIWFRNGRIHRDYDRPAIVVSSGPDEDKQCWYQDGHLHREGDKPAAIYSDGVKEWYRRGELHRSEGPAIIYPKDHPRCPKGRKYYYRSGVLYGTSDLAG